MNNTIKHRKHLLDNRKISISCIVPIHNESNNLPLFTKKLTNQLVNLTDNYEIIYIDDGSQDESLSFISSLQDPHIKCVSFSRNFGKEPALIAGINHCKGDIAILIDADFQHPIKMIDKFITKWADGFDMVYGVQTERKNESLLKRTCANIFYSIMNKLTECDIPKHAGDFRLLDRKVINAIKACPEKSLFMKGLYAWVGFKSKAIPFKTEKRKEGKSRFKYLELTELAITGLVSFSSIPLRVWGIIGFIISFLSFFYSSMIIIKTIFFGSDVPGFATIVVAVMFLGGIQLLSIGILGEYVARIFSEVKQRPRYIIDKKLGFDKSNNDI